MERIEGNSVLLVAGDRGTSLIATADPSNLISLVFDLKLDRGIDWLGAEAGTDASGA